MVKHASEIYMQFRERPPWEYEFGWQFGLEPGPGSVSGAVANLPLPFHVPCPVCQSPVMCLLSIPKQTCLVLSDGQLNRRFDFLYCWECDQYVGSSYRGNLEEGIEFLPREARPVEPTDRMLETDTPFPVIELHGLPMDESLRQIRGEYLRSYDLDILDKYCEELGVDPKAVDPGDYTFGGTPFLYHDEDFVKCQSCSQPIKIIASTPSFLPGYFDMFQNPFVLHLFGYCEDCELIYATHQCD